MNTTNQGPSLLNPDIYKLPSGKKYLHVHKHNIGKDTHGEVSNALRVQSKVGVSEGHTVEILPNRNLIAKAQTDLSTAVDELLQARLLAMSKQRTNKVMAQSRIDAAIYSIRLALARLKELWDETPATLHYEGDRLGCGARAFVTTTNEVRVIDCGEYNCMEVYTAANVHSAGLNVPQKTVLVPGTNGRVSATKLREWLEYYSTLPGTPGVNLKDYSYRELLQAVMGVVDEYEGGSQ